MFLCSFCTLSRAKFYLFHFMLRRQPRKKKNAHAYRHHLKYMGSRKLFFHRDENEGLQLATKILLSLNAVGETENQYGMNAEQSRCTLEKSVPQLMYATYSRVSMNRVCLYICIYTARGFHNLHSQQAGQNKPR